MHKSSRNKALAYLNSSSEAHIDTNNHVFPDYLDACFNCFLMMYFNGILMQLCFHIRKDHFTFYLVDEVVSLNYILDI